MIIGLQDFEFAPSVTVYLPEGRHSPFLKKLLLKEVEVIRLAPFFIKKHFPWIAAAVGGGLP
ncbi:hypothetical protein ACFLRT_04065 [Acidobacteriota bacterium]